VKLENKLNKGWKKFLNELTAAEVASEVEKHIVATETIPGGIDQEMVNDYREAYEAMTEKELVTYTREQAFLQLAYDEPKVINSATRSALDALPWEVFQAKRDPRKGGTGYGAVDEINKDWKKLLNEGGAEGHYEPEGEEAGQEEEPSRFTPEQQKVIGLKDELISALNDENFQSTSDLVDHYVLLFRALKEAGLNLEHMAKLA